MSSTIENKVRLRKPEKSGLREKMDIFSARVILQSIVETPEAIINDPMKDFIFPYSTDQIRLAVKVLSKSIDKSSINGHSQKKTSQAILHSHFFKNAVCLGLDQNGIDDPKLEFWLPVNENVFIPKGNQDASFKGSQSLEDIKKIGKVDTLDVIFSIQKLHPVSSLENRNTLTSQLHRLWLGLRWMSANLLIWEKINEIIMPEDLGESYVPRIDTGSEKVNAVDLFCGPDNAAKLRQKQLPSVNQ